MKEYMQKPVQASRTLDSASWVSRQAGLIEILQRSKDQKKSKPLRCRRLGAAITKPIPRELEYSKSTRGTTAALITYMRGNSKVLEERRYVSGGGMHAEGKVLEDLRRAVAIEKYIAGKRYDAVLFVSKSPCTSCGRHPTRTDGHKGCVESLIGTRNIGGAFFCFTIIPTKLYGRSREDQQASQAGLDLMRESGMNVFTTVRENGSPGGDDEDIE